MLFLLWTFFYPEWQGNDHQQQYKNHMHSRVCSSYGMDSCMVRLANAFLFIFSISIYAHTVNDGMEKGNCHQWVQVLKFTVGYSIFSHVVLRKVNFLANFFLIQYDKIMNKYIDFHVSEASFNALLNGRHIVYSFNHKLYFFCSFLNTLQTFCLKSAINLSQLTWHWMLLGVFQSVMRDIGGIYQYQCYHIIYMCSLCIETKNKYSDTTYYDT